jgi:hypothetical protein
MIIYKKVLLIYKVKPLTESIALVVIWNTHQYPS